MNARGGWGNSSGGRDGKDGDRVGVGGGGPRLELETAPGTHPLLISHHKNATSNANPVDILYFPFPTS